RNRAFDSDGTTGSDWVCGWPSEGRRDRGLLAGADSEGRDHAVGRGAPGMKVQLTKVAHARSGDKGDTANVGLIAFKDELYPILVREVTAERVKQHFKGICHGEVERFELPNLGALNFLLHESLGGGGTLSLMTDAQGKTFSTALLRMEVDLTDKEATDLHG